MTKAKQFEPEHTVVLTFRLRPAAIYLLKRLAVKHGGVGRAVQVATELLKAGGEARNKKIKAALQQQKPDDTTQELFSFSALPRTKDLINRLALRYYDETKNTAIRACIQLLYEMEIKEDRLLESDPAYYRMD